MLLKYGDIESEPRYERLDSSMLHADLPYQNVFDQSIVDKIVTEFKKYLLRPLEVSYRDGQYNVIDGKHRLTGIKELERLNRKLSMNAVRLYDNYEIEKKENKIKN